MALDTLAGTMRRLKVAARHRASQLCLASAQTRSRRPWPSTASQSASSPATRFAHLGIGATATFNSADRLARSGEGRQAEQDAGS